MVSGGAERQLTYLAAEQRRQGHAVGVALVNGGPNLERLQQSGADLHFIRASGNHDPLILIRLVRLIRRLRPNVVQTWLTQMDVLGGVAAKICGVPWVLSERCSELAYSPTPKNRLRDFVGARANAVVCNSSGGVKYWQPRLGSSVLVHEVPNPLPLDEINRTAPATDAEVGIALGEKMVLFIGRLAPQKNLDTLIPALALAAEHASFVVRVCGEGDEGAVRRLIAAHGLQSRVRLVGYVSRAWAWIKRADVFVSVSRFEGRANTVLEAAACGCPMILSDIPSHREAFDERSAIFVDQDRPPEIADAIVRTLQRDVATEARTRRARELVRGLSLTEVERNYHSIYESIIRTARATG